MASKYDTYTSPLAERNASAEMLRLWSPRHKFNTWRRVWLAVAEAQHELGLPVSGEQVAELRAVVERPGGITDEEIAAAERYERDLRHDVMAHVHALGDSCPKARGIIHLGMTSQDVVCNADLLLQEQAIKLIEAKVNRAVISLGVFGHEHQGLPTLGFTHYQAAQPVTVGRRSVGWANEILVALWPYCNRDRLFPYLRGMRGATGTQASFIGLFNGDTDLVDRFEASVISRLTSDPDEEGNWPQIERFAVDARERLRKREAKAKATGRTSPSTDLDETLAQFDAATYVGQNTFGLVGQTYPRVHDAWLLSILAATAAVLHKIATDIRLLCNRKELDEPFESKQIGSSAMPYKRNPMRCERICGLARFVMNLVGNAYDTAATQWLERTLDDSSNRRLSLPEAFLALDGALDLMHNVASGLVVHEAMVRKNLMAELPFLATENILMECVKAGGDRQEYHEKIRVHAQAAGMRVKQEGLDNDLIERLKADKAFHARARGGPLAHDLNWDGLMDPMKYVGRSVEQTERFIKEVVEPLRKQYGEAIAKLGESSPRV